MKTTLVTIAFVLVLFLQLAQIGELKKLREGGAVDRGAPASPSREHARDGGRLDVIRGYLDLVERYSTVARDPSRSGAAAVLYTKELNKGVAPDVAIDFYTKLLADVKDPTVERAIRFELVELYTRTPAADRAKAMEQLRTLMTESQGSAR